MYKRQDKKWSVKWKWKDGCHTPKLSNSVAQYRIKPSAVAKYDAEVSDWIKRGWLVEFDGEHEGVIPLMAVVQLNKAKVRVKYVVKNCESGGNLGIILPSLI